jgi:2-polyprenyl-3-methyl-5-hydroxy-6-metoxy-1,4-benzoquinol methylase
VLDLGKQPLANGYEQYVGNSVCAPRYPLSVSECPVCHLVQLDEHAPPEDLFRRDYPFRSGESLTWMDHCRTFADEYAVAGERALDVGAGDGTLVRILRDAGMDAWGIDPAPQCEEYVHWGYMGKAVARRIFHAPFDLIAAWNVLAHVPDLDDFLGGISDMLTEDGTLVIEVPNWDLSTWTQVYAEHLSYFTENALVGCLERRGFTVTSVTPQPTHEGSLRAVCVHA